MTYNQVWNRRTTGIGVKATRSLAWFMPVYMHLSVDSCIYTYVAFPDRKYYSTTFWGHHQVWHTVLSFCQGWGSYALCRYIRYSCVHEALMSPTVIRSKVLYRLPLRVFHLPLNFLYTCTSNGSKCSIAMLIQDAPTCHWRSTVGRDCSCLLITSIQQSGVSHLGWKVSLWILSVHL